MKEIEIKLKITDSDGLVEKVLSLGGEKVFDDLQKDVMYTNGSLQFQSYTKKAPERVLRLRRSNAGNLLTYKERLEQEHEYLLERTEIETIVEGFEKMEMILGKLGFNPYRIKEKKRVKVKFDGMTLEFDTLPFIGTFLEIEGTEETIQKVLVKLGLSIEDGINRDYTQLFYDYCNEHDLNIETPQTFEEEAKLS